MRPEREAMEIVDCFLIIRTESMLDDSLAVFFLKIQHKNLIIKLNTQALLTSR